MSLVHRALSSSLLLLAASSLAGCGDTATCELIGQYAGTFEGDASGTLTLSITEDGEETPASITLEGDTFSATGDGTLSCEDGELALTLYDDTGAEIGTFTGSMLEEYGDWALGTGEAGTWQITE